MLENEHNGIEFPRKENWLKKILRKHRAALAIGLIFCVVGIVATIEISNYQFHQIAKLVGNAATKTATTTTTTTRTVTQTITVLESVTVIVRSPNGTIISNSTG
jgi:urease accessory protein UreF